MSRLEEETRSFAETVATATARGLTETPAWEPGSAHEDRSPWLTRALRDAGWGSLAEDAALLPFCGPGGFELGRRLGPLCELDSLLGGSLLAGEVIRYGESSRIAVRVQSGGLTYFRADGGVHCPYGDAIGVRRQAELTDERHMGGDEAATRLNAWMAATVGYCAGVGAFALEETLDYARHRRAFGTTLAGLAPVQQMLAQAATTVRGLRLLALDLPGAAALAHAGPALCDVTATCQQVAGAVGFTLEFPLQRAYRRARTLALWNDAVLDEVCLTEY